MTTIFGAAARSMGEVLGIWGFGPEQLEQAKSMMR